jgi:hypothetical protein
MRTIVETRLVRNEQNRWRLGGDFCVVTQSVRNGVDVDVWLGNGVFCMLG